PLPASPRVSAENQTPSPKVVPLAPVPSVSTRETSTATPTPTPTETSTETVSFTDVADDFWARPYIETVVNRKIMSGFPDGTFKPNNPINRAEFAALLKKAFEQKATLQTPKFKDISNDFWGFPAIQETTKTGFLRGYPNNTFQPKQSIPKVQVLVALASGLDLKTTQTPQKVLQSYQDAP
ncbi:MAG TPA: S-layer protein, partial [Cyanobacteria bacterium UBA11148]|nr:S-layer protein [Cyanobacteria bacterium UBA11148]